jgi:hypothetical protein
MRHRRVLITLLTLFAVASPAGAQTAPVPIPVGGWLVPPVDAPIARPYLDPEGPYAAGHRGVDYAVPAGSLVRAAGDGRVTFAGPVADVRAVTIDHGDGVTTTYTTLAFVLVVAGDEVGQGEWVGRSGAAHAGGDEGVHFGVRVDGAYVDPMTYLGPVGLAGAVHLAPLPAPEPPISTLSLRDAITRELHGGCKQPAVVSDAGPPNDNVAVLVAGIGTHTTAGAEPAMYARVPELLGYPRTAVYRFSYAGPGGLSLHEPYDRTDTYGDLRAAAARLRELLARIARRSPGRAVDLIAHSQGGVIARIYLESMHDAWDPDLPVVDHLVTFATPHEGAPLANAAGTLVEDSISGGVLVRWLSQRARDGARWPDPLSKAVDQLRPGSDLLRSLAREDVSFGTRVLALTTASDLVVPAGRARLDNELSRVVGPAGLNGHSGVVTDAESIATAYAFLRGAAEPCPTGWDEWGPRVGAVAGWVEDGLPWAYSRVEDAVVRRALFGLGSKWGRKG